MEETTHARTVELLPWLINGTLDSGERRQVEEHLESCADCRGELAVTRGAFALYGAHLPATVLAQHAEIPEAHLYGAAGLPIERRLVEAHLDHCVACRDDVELTRESLRSLRDETAGDGGTLATVTPFVRPGTDAGAPASGDSEARGEAYGAYAAPRWLPMALAASLLLAVISAGGWSFTAQRADARNEAQRQEIAKLEERLERLDKQQAAPDDVETAGGEDGLASADLQREMDRKLRDLEERRAEAEGRADTLDRQVAELSNGVPAAGVVYVPLEGGDVLRSTASAATGAVPEIELAGAGGVLLQPAVPADLLAAGGLAYRVRGADAAVVAEGPLPVIDETAQGLGRYVSLYLPAAHLPSGSLSLEIRRDGEAVGEYAFRVQR